MNAIPETSINRLGALLPNAKPETIKALFEQCADEFCAICNQESVPPAAYTTIEQMVSFRYSQLNADGLSSQSFSGMSESYMGDYPERLKRAMYRFRRICAR